MPRTTRPAGPTYRLVLQREDNGATVVQYGRLAEERIRPILQGLSALVHVAGFKRDLEHALQRLGL
jgi:hypothetical protein